MKITKSLAGTGLLAAALLTACSSPGSATPTATVTVTGPTNTVEVQVPGPTKTVTKIKTKTVKVTVPGPTKTVTVLRQAPPTKTVRAPKAPASVAAPPASSNSYGWMQQTWDTVNTPSHSDLCAMWHGTMKASLLESWAEDAPQSVVQQFFDSKCN